MLGILSRLIVVIMSHYIHIQNHCTPETNIVLWVNYISIKSKKEETREFSSLSLSPFLNWNKFLLFKPTTRTILTPCVLLPIYWFFRYLTRERNWYLLCSTSISTCVSLLPLLNRESSFLHLHNIKITLTGPIHVLRVLLNYSNCKLYLFWVTTAFSVFFPYVTNLELLALKVVWFGI